MEEVFDDFIDKFWKSDRTVELQKLAEETSLTFEPRQRFAEQPTALKGFRIFKGKRGKRIIGIVNLVESALEWNARFYDYIYYSDGGKQKSSILEFQSRNLNLSPFRIRPRSGIRTFFGGKQLEWQIPTPEIFDKLYRIEAQDPGASELQIPDSVLSLVAAKKGLWIEGDGQYLLYYFRKKRIAVDAIMDEYIHAEQIINKILHDNERDFV